LLARPPAAVLAELSAVLYPVYRLTRRGGCRTLAGGNVLIRLCAGRAVRFLESGRSSRFMILLFFAYFQALLKKSMLRNKQWSQDRPTCYL
jgi:hypothetical protein